MVGKMKAGKFRKKELTEKSLETGFHFSDPIFLTTDL